MFSLSILVYLMYNYNVRQRVDFMIKKARIIAILIILTITVGVVSDTYSKYIANTTGNFDIMFANWEILVNNIDVTNETSSNITFNPILEDNPNVASGVIAPSSKGYFDINIDPSNVDVSFTYDISFNIENQDIPDFKITKYALVPDTYTEGDTLEFVNLESNNINGTMLFDRTHTDFKFTPFVIRVYFEWTEGAGELMDDAADTAASINARENNSSINVNANIKFNQVL